MNTVCTGMYCFILKYLAGPGGRHRARPHEGAGAVEVAASSSAGEGAHPRAGPTSGGVPPSPATRPASAPSGKSPKDSKQCRASNHWQTVSLAIQCYRV